MTGMVGSVPRQRYNELVKLGRDWVETMSSVQWQLGDAAMEIEPMRSYGGTNPSYVTPSSGRRWRWAMSARFTGRGARPPCGEPAPTGS